MQKRLIKTFSFIFMLGILATSNAQNENQINLQDNFLKNGVIAHRGAWKMQNLPQNSIASLKNSIRIGAAGSEFDVQLTADEVLVVNHDPSYEGMEIEKSNYSDLKKILLKNGEPLPTLENYLSTGMTQKKTRLILELKNSVISPERSLLLAKKVVEKVDQMKAQNWIVYISFNYEILKEILHLDNNAETMYLGGDKSPNQLSNDGIRGADYHFNAYKKDDQLIGNMQAKGILTNVWTVNDSSLMDYFLARNIDFITTDEPEMLLEKSSGKGPGKDWKLVWYDEFNSGELPDTSKWNYDTKGNSYGWGNNEAQWYTAANPKNTVISDGTLKIIARNEPISGKQYSSGRLTTKGKGDWKYGKVEVRAKLPSGNGTWPAIWMLASENEYGGWPKSGEIDIMEHVGFDPDTVFSTVHTDKFNHIKGTQVGEKLGLPTSTTEFHIYTLEWEENEIRSIVDGKLYFTFLKTGGFEAWPFDQAFHLILNLAIGGGLGGQHGIDNNKFPHTFEIDYVRVFQRIE